MMDQYTLERRLLRRGYNMLGSGCSSKVYAKPGSERCIKVGTCTDWEPYVRWSHENGYAGTFAPRVYAFHRWSPFLYTASVERLTETVGEFKKRSYDDCKIAWNVQYKNWDDLEAQFPGITAFTTHAREAGMCGDWHLSNWMLHKGRLVLVDTFSSGGTEHVRRWYPTGKVA